MTSNGVSFVYREILELTSATNDIIVCVWGGGQSEVDAIGVGTGGAGGAMASPLSGVGGPAMLTGPPTFCRTFKCLCTTLNTKT